MPYASREQHRRVNREWHTRAPSDGQCEACTRKGERCRWRGWYDGLTNRVLCNLHSRDAG